MRVCIANGDASVELEAEGGYSPDVMQDLVNRALEAYTRALTDAEDEDDE